MDSQTTLLNAFLEEVDEEIAETQIVSELHREALRYETVIKKLMVTRHLVGSAILQAMWHIYKNGLVVYLGKHGEEYNPDDFVYWNMPQRTGCCDW